MQDVSRMHSHCVQIVRDPRWTRSLQQCGYFSSFSADIYIMDVEEATPSVEFAPVTAQEANV